MDTNLLTILWSNFCLSGPLVQYCLCLRLLPVISNVLAEIGNHKVYYCHIKSNLLTEELNKLLSGVTIAQGGVLPNIQVVLLPKKKLILFLSFISHISLRLETQISLLLFTCIKHPNINSGKPLRPPPPYTTKLSLSLLSLLPEILI